MTIYIHPLFIGVVMAYPTYELASTCILEIGEEPTIGSITSFETNKEIEF